MFPACSGARAGATSISSCSTIAGTARANRMNDEPGKTMFGAQQLAWLRNALVYSHAPLKLVVNGSQMWNRANRFEGFNHFSYEQKAFADWLLAQRVDGVMFATRRPALHRAVARRAPRRLSAVRIHVESADVAPVRESRQRRTRRIRISLPGRSSASGNSA